MQFSYSSPYFVLMAVMLVVIFFWLWFEMSARTQWRRFAKKTELSDVMFLHNLRIIIPILALVAWIVFFMLLFFT